MRKVKKYYYNTESHRFEKYKLPLRYKVYRVLGFISASIVSAILIIALAFQFLDSPKEKLLKREMSNLREQYKMLRDQSNTLHTQLTELEQRDEQVYRSIFEAAPIIHEARTDARPVLSSATNLGSTKELAIALTQQLQKTKARIALQNKSLDTIEQLVAAKETMLASIPAIIPVSYHNLSSVASGFGYRIDPVYKTPKLHAGIDFAARMGTPIYATANGSIKATNYDEGGYGNHVVIAHGYGYETLYGHMAKIKVQPGDKVHRGDVIGWVGSTGKSTGPHCHYEVIKNGEKINPVHFFYNDLSPNDYDKIIKQAAVENQSFD